MECPDCGTRLDEWNPKEGGHWQAYTVKSWNCPGCRLSRESYESQHKDNPDLHGQHVRLEPTVFHPYNKPRPDKGILGG